MATNLNQAIINESFGLKRLLALTEDYVQSKITCAVNLASEISNPNYNFDKNTLRTDQCYTLSLLYGLIKKDAALCSILGMSSEFFEPLKASDIFPWLRDGFTFSKDELFAALHYATKLKKQQVSISDSVFKAIIQYAKDVGVVAQNSAEDKEVAELLDSVIIETAPAVNPEMQTLLYDAVVSEEEGAVDSAVEAGADPNLMLEGGMTALHLAVSRNCLTAIADLIKYGARIDSENSEGDTPLSMAVKARNTDAIELLLQNETKVNYLNASGHTAIHIAAREGFGDIIEILIQKGGADIKVTDFNGYTPLHWAAAAGSEEIVELLNKRGGSVNTVSKNGWTPLHAAAEYNHQKVVSLLMECGADINAMGEGGFTPMHMAADKGHVDIVKLLVMKGANHLCKSNDGYTPLDMARDSEHEDVVAYLNSLNV